VSLIPELTRRLEDVGSPTLDFVASPGVPPDVQESLSDSEKQTKERLSKMGFPLQVFGEGSFFQPYIPLQQIDVLISKETKSFVVGTTNAIFTHHKACAIDVMVNVRSP
jgi:hypothetical protein